MFILDSHCDTPSMLLEGVDLQNRGERTHLDIPRMKEGLVDGVFFAIYTPAALDYKAAVEHSLSLISKCYDFVDCNRDKVAFAFSAEEALQNKEKGLISIFMGMENGSPIGEDLALLRFYHKMGVRYLTLCHSRHNQICDSCAPQEPNWGGLSPFGVELVKECNRIGMMIDCSHVSDDAFYDILKHSSAPFVATHSSCRALCSHKRNLTDQMIKDLATAGGVVQVNFYPFFIDEDFRNNAEINELSNEYDKWQQLYRSDLRNEFYRENYFALAQRLNSYPTPSYKKVVDHIEHIISLVGVKHVGIGSDFDGIDVAPEGLRDISMLPVVVKELSLRGYSEAQISDIMGGNFLRVMSEVAQKASF